MKTILMFQWFDCSDAGRRAELESCVEHNLRLDFDESIIFNDAAEPRFLGDRITNRRCDRRMTYRDFIDVVNEPRNYGALVVLANTDIRLASNLLDVASVIQPGDFLCFSRYEASSGRLAADPWCTQDVWAMVSQPIHSSVVWQSGIPLGMPGCEIRFAEMMFNAGYSVFNPCLDIRNLHMHANQVPHRDDSRIYGAYLFTPPCRLIDIAQRSPGAHPTPCYLAGFMKDRLLAIR